MGEDAPPNPIMPLHAVAAGRLAIVRTRASRLFSRPRVTGRPRPANEGGCPRRFVDRRIGPHPPLAHRSAQAA